MRGLEARVNDLEARLKRSQENETKTANMLSSEPVRIDFGAPSSTSLHAGDIVHFNTHREKTLPKQISFGTNLDKEFQMAGS